MCARQVTRSSTELFWRLLLVLAVAAVAAKYLSRIRLSESERDPDPFVMPPGTYPGAVVAGASGCGTRALYKVLGSHPEAALIAKDTEYFKYRLKSDWNLYADKLYQTEGRKKIKGKVLIEKTAGFFTNRRAPKGIYQMNAKVILMLCNPVTKALKAIQEKLQEGGKGPNDQKAIESLGVLKKLNLGGSEEGSLVLNETSRYIAPSSYPLHLPKWLDRFSLGKTLLILDGDNFSERPWQEVEKAQEFLGLQVKIREESFYYNETSGFHCATKPGCPPGPNRRRVDETQLRSRFPPDLVDKLESFFSAEDSQTRRLAGRSFGWMQ